ncbi:hypothetical protein [Streptomyces sp. NPDC086182]|jgi:predicted RNA-binding protein with RPS1 domain|uniref:hypothetical protein n=1 Tax=Streptomyces sp. NPDC086182 TaxID=3155058 RepID=UPI0034168693
MSEYSWAADGAGAGPRARAAWPAICQALPLGTKITGEVVGRQRFGVFLRIDEMPDATGLAEITAAPRNAVLPAMGESVSGQVIWHADHNCQVKIKLAAWKAEA